MFSFKYEWGTGTEQVSVDKTAITINTNYKLIVIDITLNHVYVKHLQASQCHKDQTCATAMQVRPCYHFQLLLHRVRVSSWSNADFELLKHWVYIVWVLRIWVSECACSLGLTIDLYTIQSPQGEAQLENSFSSPSLSLTHCCWQQERARKSERGSIIMLLLGQRG